MLGAGRYWGDDGAGDILDSWNPWSLEKLWRHAATGSDRHGQDDLCDDSRDIGALEEPQWPEERVIPQEETQEAFTSPRASRSPRHVMFEITSEASEDEMPPDEIPPEAQETVPNPRRSAERLRINSSAVHRMVSSHISKKETADVKDQGNLWANWNPSHRNAEPEHDWGREQVHNGQYDGRSSGSSRPAHIRPRKSAPGENRVRIGKELADSWTTREVLQATENHLEEFDVVHSVVALHRIAKSTDYRELRSSNKLREQLASLASNAADAVQPGPDGEVPHVKEVSKALWALAKVGPWSDSMEGYAPRSSNVDWGRGWSSVHRSLQALGYMALDRLAELDSHGLSNVAWSFAVARMNGTGTQVATVALEILPDFQAQGLANTAWAMARLLADYEGRAEHRFLALIAREVAKNPKDFTPQGLANIGWAFATLSMRHEGLMDTVANELAEGAGNWSQQNLANILWAFAKVLIQPKPSGAVQAVAEDVLMTLNAWSALNMASLTWAFAKLSLRHPKLYAAIEREVQQKLWNFSSQNLVNVAWSFAKVMVARRSFFEELGQCAAQLAPDFNPQNCSNAVWAFATVSYVNGELFQATARRASEIAKELVAQDLANLSWAFAKLSRRDAALEETIASEVLRKVKTCSPQHLSIIVYSFAQMMAAGGGLAAQGETWQIAPSANAMVEAVLDMALQRVREFDAQGLTNLTQSLAKLEMTSKDVMLDALIQESAPKISSFSNQELAMLAWATARLGRFSSMALRMVAKETKKRLQKLTSQDVSVLVWSFVRSGPTEETAEEGGVKGRKDTNLGVSMLKTLIESIMRLIPDLMPQDLSTIIWGYATAGIDCPDMIETVADESVGKVRDFAPQDMANIAWGLAKMGLLHEELLQVLSKDFVLRVQECQAQHLSIAAWSFAKLGVSAPKLFGAIGHALSQRAHELDPQGVGNSLWAFGVLCFWHEPFVQAVGRRGISSASELTHQEMANVSFGLRTLLCWCRQSKEMTASVKSLETLLLDFLVAASNHFCRKAEHSEGASWTDFANVAKVVAEECPHVPEALTELEARFRRLHLEPLLEGLEKLLRGEALYQLQEVLDEASTNSNVFGGVPHLGEFYSREALKRLGLEAKGEEHKIWFPGAQEVPEWIENARRQCRSEVQVWQIPATDTVVAHVSWDVSCMENTWRNEGRVYYAASQRALAARGVAAPVVPKEVEDLLAPLRQHLRRDSHPERLALLELTASMIEADESGKDVEVKLLPCEGSVRIYVSQYPCVSCLAVFCQFRRWCPNIELEVAFDNAWTSFCGRPRNLRPG